jgi:short-subunit dehydrogenase
MTMENEAASGRTVLITGATSGIGYELAKLFAADGYRLVLVARQQAALDRVAAELIATNRIAVKVISQDLSVPDAAASIMGALEKDGIDVEVLVNDAGFGTFGLFAETDAASELAMMQVNMVALTDLTKRCLRGMLARRSGKILNVASTAAFQPGPLMAVYYASKAYVLSFSEAIACELEGTGVCVSVLCPGPTRSAFQARAKMGTSKLFESGVMDASSVAEAGYRGLMDGKTLIIPGLRNRLLTLVVKLSPRSRVPGAVKRIQESRHADGRSAQ